MSSERLVSLEVLKLIEEEVMNRYMEVTNQYKEVTDQYMEVTNRYMEVTNQYMEVMDTNDFPTYT